MLPWVSHRISLRFPRSFPVISHRTPTKITRSPIPRCLASGRHANDAALTPAAVRALQSRTHDLHIPSASEVGWGVLWKPLGETKTNVRKPNGETMGKWSANGGFATFFGVVTGRYLTLFVFCCWKRKFLPFNVERHEASLLDRVQGGEEKAVQNGEALHNNWS